MKQFTGYLVIIGMLLSSYWFSTSIAADENQVQSPSQYIKENVKIGSINVIESTKITGLNDMVIDTLYGTAHRVYIPYEQLPRNVINAFIAAEDQHFFDHPGIDGAAIIRAFVVNAKSGSLEQGGSTITQQLAKNLYLSNTKTYERKINEAFLSYQLEQQLSKEKILELYSNVIYFGNGVYGIETASRFYFGKSVEQLTIAETALLCGIPNRPAYYDPIEHLDQTLERQHHVLSKMHEQGFISQKQYEQALREQIQLNVTRPHHFFPDYVSYVLDEFEQLVSKKEGFAERINKAKSSGEKQKVRNELKGRVYELIYEQGIRIHTSLNAELQTIAEETIRTSLPNGVEGAFVIIDHMSQQIVALIGGKEVGRADFNRAYQAYRQPGSAIKPLLAFAPYIEVRSTPLNVPVDASPFCKKDYCPSNYGQAVYGMVSMREAIGSSINTAAVRMVEAIGIEKAFSFLAPFTFEKVLEQDQHISSVLGGFTYGVSPLELTDAYTTFSHNGTYQPARAIQSVTTPNGKVLYKWEDRRKQVWSDATNRKMRILFNYVVTGGTARSAYVNTSYIGGKTGTTNDTKDVWFVGMTDKYTAGIWVGKDKPAPIPDVAGKAVHLKMWQDIMSEAVE
ncbi:transglycosylase domain-containing protein [Alkalihalobacillus sp. AL-G]|uniref:transglycosylase domain-containing protein n=1 Tax=Alkalihalobacillus sp. AL-G TaxID=2926399 RepID=UPI00272C2434|nr:transglycosylase domain-containing protein [Alkalihalobacillus sp. AL-G]WLD94011.1 penicillin-binding protein [Alkalihalobacillus sp. AL-G]